MGAEVVIVVKLSLFYMADKLQVQKS